MMLLDSLDEETATTLNTNRSISHYIRVFQSPPTISIYTPPIKPAVNGRPYLPPLSNHQQSYELCRQSK